MAAIIDHLRHHHHQQQHKKTTGEIKTKNVLWPFFAAHPIIALSMWINWSRQATQAHASLYADCGNTPNMRLWCKLSTPLVKDRFQYPVSDRLKKTVNAVFYFLLWTTKAQRQPWLLWIFKYWMFCFSTLFENYSKMSHFVLLKRTCLVTLFDLKLYVFQNSAKWIIFGIFHYLLSTPNVNVARFARNVK